MQKKLVCINLPHLRPGSDISQSHWQSQIESGAMDAAQWPKLGYAECIDGFAIPIADDPAHKFRCKNVCTSFTLIPIETKF